jgi:hypothetical protein
MVIASFQQTLWAVVPMCSGGIRNKCLGYVFGGDVIRLFHGHKKCYLWLPCTVKHAHTVTSIKQSPVLKGHIFLVLS